MEMGALSMELVESWHMHIRQVMGDSIMMLMRDGVLVQSQMRLTWRRLPCMKLDTYLDSIIARLKGPSCGLPSPQEEPKVYIGMILMELKPYIMFECPRIWNLRLFMGRK